MSEQKLWEKILQESSQRDQHPEGNLILVGRRDCGVKHFISVVQKGPGSLGKNSVYSQLIAPDDPIPITSPIHYSHINAKNIEDPQSLKISRINIWTLDHPQLKDLLEFALKPKQLNKTIFGIVLDWSQPWTFLEDLHQWIEIWHEKLGKVLSSLPLDDQDQMVQGVERYMKAYKDPSEETKEEKIDEAVQEIPLPEGVLQVNLGVPIVIICCKSDLIWSVDKSRDQCERILDFTLKSLREFAVTYGASIIYTSSKTGINVNTFYNYIVHRLYGFRFTQKAQIIDRESIFIPAGWDSPNLIREMDYLGILEKQFNDLLPKPRYRGTKKEEIPFVSDQDFLVQVQERLSKTSNDKAKNVVDILRPAGISFNTSSDSNPAPDSSSDTQGRKNENLKMFYEMLLKKGNKEDSEA
ncbi:unnamed protein product [Blepharisma stoltei]|uniref:Dynein light intermediate chain n=1 Tax=Blepharisma stoltei TaxID=1481888 RepID=A0AAU9JM38_9CILI|nr:unnamed protein product [Blepharisma stoltei]